MKFATLALLSIVTAQQIHEDEKGVDQDVEGADFSNGSAQWRFTPDASVPAGTASIDVRVADIVAQH